MNEQPLFNWFSSLVDEAYTVRGFAKSQQEDARLEVIFNIIKQDAEYNRHKATAWIRKGEFPYMRRGLILQDFYPTVAQCQMVLDSENLVVLTKEEFQRKAYSMRSPRELELEAQVEELRDRLVRVDSNAQLQEAFRDMVQQQATINEQMELMDKMARQIEKKDYEIIRLKEKLKPSDQEPPAEHWFRHETIDENGIDHSHIYPTMTNSERIHV